MTGRGYWGIMEAPSHWQKGIEGGKGRGFICPDSTLPPAVNQVGRKKAGGDIHSRRRKQMFIPLSRL